MAANDDLQAAVGKFRFSGAGDDPGYRARLKAFSTAASRPRSS